MSEAIASVQTIDTPDGPFTIVVDADGAVLASGWSADVDSIVGRIHPELRPSGTRPGSTAAADAVAAYYGGDLSAIDDVAVRQRGTRLQQEGWAALRRIRAGRPLTYTEFAAALGAPTAVRAAAAICARNAPALFVPCHRVLRSDGSLGGFAWGVQVKRALLAREAG
ncbi:methylated-DNA--[protein]-cysteine S-methyltransferase [Tessaracoccus sp. OS52]|uniref:methylated-DNA--[protein]-cysteine S-methyltransferase n=1 Tax=Tessaracoccus sp. OS52 TaxID=2886691 RepID=UPI001D128237|nr:methylated-DNA--[protein]-cysteine S-methyltransferase [Tessaracoccus sp. OS52]MCC2593729.1 methylated-DNA--[protein]-cysteine S-methyltransferase [Tessaracoccus sp. OS52]